MKTKHLLKSVTILAAAFAPLVLAFNRAQAHCDGLDGPVVKAAQRALMDSNVNHVLIWVQKNDEAEIRGAFDKTLAVRTLSAAAKELADLYFFETLVRIHRAGEGAPYTGLKPAGRHLGPAIPAGDKALETGDISPVLKVLSRKVEDGLRDHFKDALSKSNFKENDIEAGRAFVKAYVEYIHYVEGVYEAAVRASQGHFRDAQANSHETAAAHENR